MKNQIPMNVIVFQIVGLVSLCFFSLYFFVGCSYFNEKMGQKDDWVGEELLEAGIKIETGLDIDLTPDSKE